MKRTLSLVLALVMVLGSFSSVFAAEAVTPQTAGEFLQKVGVLKGNQNGDLKLKDDLKRRDAVVLLSRLMDKEDEAKDFPSEDLKFDDITDSNYNGYVAWAVSNEIVNGKSETKFDPNGDLTAQHFATMLLRVLGHDVAGDAYDKALETAKELGLLEGVEVENRTTLTRGMMAVVTLNALGTPVKGSTETLADKLGIEMPTPAKLEVKEAKISTVKSFLVVFNKAVENTDKMEFTAKRGSLDVKVAPKWNEAKTEATLEMTNRLVEGEYVLTVTNKAVEPAVALGEFKLVAEKEKIESIEFDSDVIVRINDEEGVIGYVVKNQYGDDITDSAIGRSLQWMVSTNHQTPDIDYKSGILTIKHDGATFNQLKDLKTVVITVRDITTGFIQTKTVGVSENVSIVSDIKLLGIIDDKGNAVEDLVFDTTKSYYLAFEATDVNGKKVESYAALTSTVFDKKDPVTNVITKGLKVLDLRVSNTTNIVTDNGSLKLERHPDNAKKGAFLIQLQGTSPEFDMPVSFIAMAPFTGKTSTLNVTLKRSAKVEIFTLQTPSEIATAGRSIEIPFTALDQNGKEVKRFEDLENMVNVEPKTNVEFVRQSDGTAKLFGKFNSKGLQYVTATVKNSLKGSFTQVAIDVKDPAKAESIESLRHPRGYTHNGSWTATSSADISDFVIRDQFDNELDLSTDTIALNSDGSAAYRVLIGTNNASAVNVTGDSTVVVGSANYVEVKEDYTYKFVGGTVANTATITYLLQNSVDGTTWNTIDEATAIVYNVDFEDVVSARISQPTKEIFMTQNSTRHHGNAIGTATGNNFAIYGVTKDGLVVNLPANKKADFITTDARFSVSGSRVIATGNFGNATTASTTVAGHVYGPKGVLTATTQITANSANPVAKTIHVFYGNSGMLRKGIYTVDNNVITVNDITQFNLNIADVIAFGVSTQYGYGTESISRAVVTKLGTGTVTLNANGSIATSTLASGDEVVISVYTTNGLMQNVVIKVK